MAMRRYPIPVRDAVEDEYQTQQGLYADEGDYHPGNTSAIRRRVPTSEAEQVVMQTRGQHKRMPPRSEEQIKTGPTKQRRANNFKAAVILFLGACLTVWLVQSFMIVPFFLHWHNGDSPMRSYAISVNGKLCDVTAKYVVPSDPKARRFILVLIAPEDGSKSTVLEMPSSLSSASATPVVEIRPDFDSAGNYDLQTYVDGLRGPRITVSSQGFSFVE